MKAFICGGGSGEQTQRALHRLNEVIRHELPCLYIPLAMEENNMTAAANGSGVNFAALRCQELK